LSATALLWIAIFLNAPPVTAEARPDHDGFPFAHVDVEAVAHYRQGWVEILSYGRWSEAERHYREAIAQDPDFLLGMSVLARITADVDERNTLYERVNARLEEAGEYERLLLTTYQQTLELFALRETGAAIPDNYRRSMAARAVDDYGRFLGSYPGEWSVMIEYVEWVHALEGPEAALQEIERLRSTMGQGLDFSYFPAYFHAELGQLTIARKRASEFAARIDDPGSPQPHYLNAFLHYQAGDLTQAQQAIERALALDSRHLLAQRLQGLIERALED